MAQQCATHLFRSLYMFSVDGRKTLLKSYQAVAAPHVSCEALEANCFQIRCPLEDETSLSVFIQLATEFIAVESDKNLEVFEEPRVTRVRGTNPKPTKEESVKMATSQEEPSSEGLLIEYQNIVRTWVPSKSGRDIGARVSDQMLSMIGGLCNCRIERLDESRSDVTLRGDTEQDIEKALLKLRVADEAATKIASFPYIFSFPIAEGDIYSQLQMTSLKDLNAKDPADRRVKTTLLSPTSSLIKSVRSALVISMIQYGRLVAVKQICPQPVAEGRWFREDPVQNQQAQIVTTTVTSIDATLDIPKTPTGQWLLRSTDPNSFIDPFQPAEVKAKEEEIPKAKKVTYKVPLPPMISKLSTKRARIARGVGTAKTAKAQSSTERDNEFVDLKTSHQTSEENKLPSIQGSRLLPHLRYLAKEQALEEESLPITGSIGLPPHQKSPLRKPALEEICAPSLPVGLPPHQQSLRKENQAMINDHGSINQIGSEQTLVGEESQAASSNPGPPIATPYLPRMAIPGPSPSESGWKLVDRGRAGRLIDTSEPIEEKVQAPEKDRTLKRTMGQKAPSHKLPGGSTALFKGFDDAAIKLLNLALYCQGPIDFEVGIGRLLIDPSKGSMEFKNKAFSISEWSSAFPTSSSIGPITLETHFASRLTTSSSDIQSILDIPLSQGRRLFNDRGAPRKVSYVFLCKSKNDKQIVIDIDEDGTFKVLGPGVFVGALDWHFPKRSFDARLCVRAHEPLLRVYHQQAESIASNMKLTRDPETLILTTKPMHDELVVQSITRRRKTAHAVRTYPDLLLHLCEVQEFELSSSDNGLRGVIKLSKDMIQANRLWWEVNITSTSATAVLSEGEILELGEIATWNPEAIINRGVVRHLHNLTTEVVTKIDHVGFHNKGAKGSSGTKSTSYQPSVQSYPKAVQTSAIAPDSYW